MSEIINAVEAAKRIAVRPSTISYWIEHGLLPCTRISKGAIIIMVDDLMEADRKSREDLRRSRHIKTSSL